MDGSSGDGEDSDESDWTGMIFFFIVFGSDTFSCLDLFLSCNSPLPGLAMAWHAVDKI